MIDDQTSGFFYVVALGLIVSTVFYLLFTYLRPKYPTIYDYRNYLSHLRDSDYLDYDGHHVSRVHPRPTPGLFGWLNDISQIKETDIIERVSYDAALFLIFVQGQRWTFIICTILVSIILIPTYATGGGNGGDGLGVLSAANINGKSRLWATLVTDYMVVSVVLYRLWVDYKKYAHLRRTYRSRINPANYAIVVQDIPKDKNNTKEIRKWFENLIPGMVTEVIRVRDAKTLTKSKAKFHSAVMKREKAEWAKENKGEKKAKHRPGFCGVCMCWKQKVDSVEYWQSEQLKWQNTIESERKHVKRTYAAIVLLESRMTAAFIAQTNFAGHSYEWNVSRAPEPKDVNWGAFRIPRWQVPWRKTVVLTVVILLTFFWLIPATFVVSLVNVEELAEVDAFSWLKPLVESPALGGLFSGLLPSVLLSIIVSLIPTVIRLLVSMERLYSLHHIDAKTRTYFYVFNIFGQFIFILFGGSLLGEIERFTDDPGSIVTLLATSVPKNGIFFSSFLIVSTFIPLSKELCNPARVLVRWVKLKFLAKTERQRRAVETSGGDFPYFKFYGLAMLVSLLGIIYMTLSPVVSICALMFYLIACPVFKYLLSYTTYREWDGGGYDYGGAYWGIIVALVLRQLTMIGYYGVKKAPAQSALGVPPLVLIILVSAFCARRYGMVVKHGSIADVVADENKGVPSRYLGLYEHPGLKEIGEVKNLSGVVPFDDAVEDDSPTSNNDEDVDVEALKPPYKQQEVVE